MPDTMTTPDATGGARTEGPTPEEAMVWAEERRVRLIHRGAEADYERAALAVLLSLAREGMRLRWQPIETAPKDTRLTLFVPKLGPVFGRWDDDRYSRKPRPYWTNDGETLWGTRDTRANQPTHWQPLPAGPVEPETEVGNG